jgi:hypothetical protein
MLAKYENDHNSGEFQCISNNQATSFPTCEFQSFAVDASNL